jgi:uracil-DNA glycosylase
MNYPNEPISFHCLLENSHDWLKIIDPDILLQTEKKFNAILLHAKHHNQLVFPEYHDLFSLFNNCSINNIKVVILGQDPYHNKNQANGIAFSINGTKIPPSLRNIFKECGKQNINSGNLINWVNQGVFLLNCTLSVIENKPNSHLPIWKDFTDHIINIIQQLNKNIIFCLWGNFAIQKTPLINPNNNIILQSSHPSPLSATKTNTPFIGSNVFNKINTILNDQNQTTINW